MAHLSDRNGATLRFPSGLVNPGSREGAVESRPEGLPAAKGTAPPKRMRRNRRAAGMADDAILSPLVADQMRALRTAEQGRAGHAGNFGDRGFHVS